MTGNRNAHEKEINEGEMQLPSVTGKKIIDNNYSTLRQLTGILDDNNCGPDHFAKKKVFSSLCQ